MTTGVPEQLGSRYELGDLLGRGGMAEVHIGQDGRLGRKVAVKMLRPDMARDPSFQARFRREAHSAASLNHPSIVAIYDTGEDQWNGNPVPYIVMEYVDGSTLRELQAAGNRLVPERALEIVDGVLDALAYSHRHGIVHRDIKPANVMLTRAGDVKVMDFGIARAVADQGATMTQTSAVIGTAQYLSPEQARGEQVDARSDLYSTGCLLYELLTGRPPFVGDSPVSVAYQHVREEPLPPSSLDPDVPAEVDSVVLKALTKDRDQRYQTADEMRADIARALTGQSVAPAAAATQQMGAMPATAAATTTFPAATTDEDSQEQRGGRALAYALLAVAVAAVFVIAALIGNSLFDGGGGARVNVPTLRGETLASATQILGEAKLEVGQVTQANDPNIPEGAVIESDPQEGTEVAEGRQVDLTISSGVETTAVPTLVGLTQDAATEALREAGLEVGEISPVPSDENRSVVLRATPREGRTVPVKTKVALRVANGDNKVPDVVGDSEGEARSALEQAGFQVNVEERNSADKPEGTVLEQSPDGGSTSRLESTVTIVVAKAPPEPTTTPPSTPPTSTPATTTPPSSPSLPTPTG